MNKFEDFKIGDLWKTSNGEILEVKYLHQGEEAVYFDTDKPSMYVRLGTWTKGVEDHPAYGLIGFNELGFRNFEKVK